MKFVLSDIASLCLLFAFPILILSIFLTILFLKRSRAAQISTSQPPTVSGPFSGIGEETLREQEELVDEITPAQQHTEYSGSTLPPENVVVASTTNGARDEPVISAKQALLQLACKRKRLSTSGTKHKLAERLSQFGVRKALKVRDLAIEFNKHGVDVALQASAKLKSPNWTCHEAARLCHVIADPRHATALGKLYNKLENRAELDQARNDPWSAEFVDLFNDPDYKPIIPDGHDGVTDDLLLSFEPTLHPHTRNGSFLEARWNKMRSKYTVAREKFTRSGQGENDVFDTFTDGDDTLAYMHCVFYGRPSLETILRALPDGCGVEAGLEEISDARRSTDNNSERKRRKITSDALLAEGMSQISKAVLAPVEVNIRESKTDEISGKFDEFDMSDRIAGTVSKLMTLEATIRANLRNAVLDNDDEYVEELRSRLANVQKRIDRALSD